MTNGNGVLKLLTSEPIGIYFLASEKYLLAPRGFPHKHVRIVEEALGLDALMESVCESGLIGLFCAGNSNGLLVPNAQDEKRLSHALREIEVAAVEDRHTALGNLILANDRGALISKLFGHLAERKIRDALGVEVARGTVAGLDTVGSCGIATNSGVLLHPEATDSEIELVESVLKASADIGTLSRGGPFVGSLGIANSRGAAIGRGTTPVEITRLEEALFP